MRSRNPELQAFVHAAEGAYDRFLSEPNGLKASRKIFARLESPQAVGVADPRRLPACANLSAALGIGTTDKALVELLKCFAIIEPMLHWRHRESYDATASPNFFDGHGNVMILGPGGLEERADVQIGFSLLAPHVRYPDHRHPPEEVYLVLSDGEFQHAASDWFSPGIGGTIYNSPGIRHAMRSGPTPLFAMWILLAQS
ncbi:dimethylsulfonioproprionate lyase family protein [Acidisoma sp. S159]|uniref:dimethylsulfonioproprionate lyase family protein n=1 Tax=Acidisoma sp. S159 TaxID=1747225 RepID=UPI00131C0F9A|nr:dimethylsulfonioproprionate lyase family protein [Acidisoma sp. S159]